MYILIADNKTVRQFERVANTDQGRKMVHIVGLEYPNGQRDSKYTILFSIPNAQKDRAGILRGLTKSMPTAIIR
jgi:uncharacterized protein YceH (UPF0502 family)